MHNCNNLTFDLMFPRHTIKLELVARLDIIYYLSVLVSIHISVHCEKEKKDGILKCIIYRTFALTWPLTSKVGVIAL